MKAGLMSFMAAADQHIGKRVGEAAHENEGDAVCIDEQAVPRSGPVIGGNLYSAGSMMPNRPSKLAWGIATELPSLQSRMARALVIASRHNDLWLTARETLSRSIPTSPLAAFDPSRHKIVEAKKYEQDMADLSLFREKMGQMIEDELAALSDFEDFDETPVVHMSAGADGIFRPNT